MNICGLNAYLRRDELESTRVRTELDVSSVSSEGQGQGGGGHAGGLGNLSKESHPRGSMVSLHGRSHVSLQHCTLHHLKTKTKEGNRATNQPTKKEKEKTEVSPR